MAYPSKWTPELEAELVELLKDNYVYDACEKAGISTTAFYERLEFAEGKLDSRAPATREGIVSPDLIQWAKDVRASQQEHAEKKFQTILKTMETDCYPITQPELEFDMDSNKWRVRPGQRISHGVHNSQKFLLKRYNKMRRVQEQGLDEQDINLNAKVKIEKPDITPESALAAYNALLAEKKEDAKE